MRDSDLDVIGRTNAALTSKDYFDTYSEAHRRRSTQFNFPAGTILFALYHPSRFTSSFSEYVEVVLKFLSSRAKPLNYDDGSFDASEIANKIAGYYNYDNPTNLNERLVFEFEQEYLDITWRFEVHREYIVLTIFVGLFLGDLEESSVRECYSPGVDSILRRRSPLLNLGLSKESWAEISMDPTFFYSELEAYCRDLQDELLNEINTWVSGRNKSRGNRLKRPPVLFANFFGCVLPWTALPFGLDRQAGPIFSGPTDVGLESGGRELNLVMRRASEYLGKIRDSELGFRLLGSHKPDLVACYIDRGSNIFVSTLGSRKNDQDCDPGRFLVLYDDPATGTADCRPSGLCTDDYGAELSRRMSRTVGRLFDLGVLRLAALRNMVQMKDFGQFLRSMELQVQRVSFGGAGSRLNVRRLRTLLGKRSLALSEPVIYRSARTQYYLSNIESISVDIGTIEIPGWQTYDAFMRRRLQGSLRYISNVGKRYENLLQTLGAISQFSIANDLLNIQRTGELFAAVFILYYLSSIGREFAEHLPSISKVVLTASNALAGKETRLASHEGTAVGFFLGLSFAGIILIVTILRRFIFSSKD